MAEVAGHSPVNPGVGSLLDQPHLSPPIELVEPLPNPHFVFPALPVVNDENAGRPGPRANRPAPLQPSGGHRRGLSHASRGSVNALPDFSFNPGGLSAPVASTPPASPTQISPTTPSRGHRRGGSEYIGANEKGAQAELVSTSPQKAPVEAPLPTSSSAPPSARLGPPAGRRGHAHRRSGAMSMTSQDMKAIMKPAGPQHPSSAPNTPMENKVEPTVRGPRRLSSEPSLAKIEDGSPDKSPGSETPDRPVSRARVGFSDNVEFIPRRPLSTISSETESSQTTSRGHSASGSLSSVMSNGPASPGSRLPRSSLSTTLEEEASNKRPRTAEASASPRLAQDEDFLDVDRPAKRPASFSTLPRPELEELDVVKSQKTQKRRTLLGFGSRRIDPSSAAALKSPEDSAIGWIASPSLSQSRQLSPTRKSKPARLLESRKVAKKPRKVKSWTRSIMSKKAKCSDEDESDGEADDEQAPRRSRSLSEISARPPTPLASHPSVEPDDETEVPDQFDEAALEDLFNREDELVTLSTPTNSNFAVSSPNEETPRSNAPIRPFIREPEEDAAIDLDAALSPSYPDASKSPSSRGRNGRKRMHSSRPDREMAALNLRPFAHRRAESAPEYSMQPFFRNSNKSGSVVGSDMEDVFEEEEEEDAMTSSASTPAFENPPSVTSPGIQVTDADDYLPSADHDATSGLGILPPPATALKPSGVDPDEASPLEIVEDHEEPRDGSQPRSSDSTVTSLVPTDGKDKEPIRPVPFNLNIPQYYNRTAPSLTESSVSSPGFSPYQSSFETPRLGTAASSVTDNRTVSSIGASDLPAPVLRPSVDDVPSLTSSRSTMTSTAIPSNRHSRSMRHLHERASQSSLAHEVVLPSPASERRRKRSSIVSLGRLVSAGFGERSKLGLPDSRPATEGSDGLGSRPGSMGAGSAVGEKKKEKRLSRLLFWKNNKASAN